MKKIISLFVTLALLISGVNFALAVTPVTICDQPEIGQAICGGAIPTHILSAASTNSNLITTAAPHIIYDVTAFNTNATTAYLKFYDVAVAPTCNISSVVATYPLVQNVPFSIASIVGKQFNNGVGICITGGIADNDNTNATTGIVVDITFK